MTVGVDGVEEGGGGESEKSDTMIVGTPLPTHTPAVRLETGSAPLLSGTSFLLVSRKRRRAPKCLHTPRAPPIYALHPGATYTRMGFRARVAAGGCADDEDEGAGRFDDMVLVALSKLVLTLIYRIAFQRSNSIRLLDLLMTPPCARRHDALRTPRYAFPTRQSEGLHRA